MEIHDPEIRKEEVKDSQLMGDGKFALGVAIGLVIALITYLVISSKSVFLTNAQLIEAAPALSALVVATVSLLISFRALTEQKRMRQAGTDPVLVAHLGQREDEPIVVTLNITNVGAGAAMNVYMKIVSSEHNIQNEMMTNVFEARMFSGDRPVRIILQNTSVSFQLGTGPSLIGDTPLPSFDVELSYQDIDGSKYSSKHTIDVSEFEDRPANSPATTKIWRELEKIRKSLEKTK